MVVKWGFVTGSLESSQLFGCSIRTYNEVVWWDMGLESVKGSQEG